MVLSREKGLSEDVSSRGLAQAVDDHLALSINVGNVHYYEWFYTCRNKAKGSRSIEYEPTPWPLFESQPETEP